MIEECAGYKSLLEAVERDETRQPRFHDYRGKLAWAIERARHYAEKTGLAPEAILDAWEGQRRYWYMNFYQDANQPLIESDRVRVFETIDAVLESVGDQGFRCPHCSGVSKSPYACNSGIKLPLINSGGKPEVCNWKIGGLFGSLGKGVHIFVKDEFRIDAIFMPIAWEKAEEPATA